MSQRRQRRCPKELEKVFIRMQELWQFSDVMVYLASYIKTLH